MGRHYDRHRDTRTSRPRECDDRRPVQRLLRNRCRQADSRERFDLQGRSGQGGNGCLCLPQPVGRLCFGGSWDEVAERLQSEASTSSQGLLIRGIESDPHPKPAAASRVRQLKEDSGLTWDQLRRLLGVSRRAVHMWAGGGRINAQNEDRLVLVEQIVAALGGKTPADRRSRLLSPRGTGRSIFQELAYSASPTAATGIDIEALTESTGAGETIHGDFLFTEVIDDGEQDR